MAHEPLPSLDLNHDHLLGLHLVGTVELPSHPGGARILAVRYPAPKGGSPPVLPQDPPAARRLSQRHAFRGRSITSAWFDSRPRPEKAAQPANLTGDEIKEMVTKMEWAKHVKDDRVTHEVEVRPNQTGTVHVPEAAPVVVRAEATVPAATSREAAPFAMAFACPRTTACPHSR